LGVGHGLEIPCVNFKVTILTPLTETGVATGWISVDTSTRGVARSKVCGGHAWRACGAQAYDGVPGQSHWSEGRGTNCRPDL